MELARIFKPQWCELTVEGRKYWDLICAILSDNQGELKNILEGNLDNAKLEFWYTPPLEIAVLHGNLESVKILWAAYQYEKVSDLIQIAYHRSYSDVSEFLVDQIGGLSDKSALLLHQSMGDTGKDFRRLVFDNNELVDQRDREGKTPLHLAVLSGDLVAVKDLIEAGAAIDVIDHKGFRPIHYAYWKNSYWSAQEGPKEIPQILFDAGAKDSITLAAIREDLDTIKLLLAENLSLANDGDTLGKRPLSAAVEVGSHDIVKALLSAGADPSLEETRTNPAGSALMLRG